MGLARLHNVRDFRRAAKRALPRPIFDYLDGGADDEWSLANNVSAFERYELLPSSLRDVSKIDMTARVLGAKLSAPVILSPTGMSRLFHHDKEPAVARAAAAAGLMYSLSTMATTSIEDVAAVAGPKMFQLYIHRDRGLTRELIARCKAAGYDAICLTVDAFVAGNRERDRRSGFVMPPKLTPASLASFALHPGWTLNYLRDSDFSLLNVSKKNDPLSRPMGVIEYIDTQFERAVTWEAVADIAAEWGGPFAVKGLQSPQDAALAAEAGASAVMISNHGGRQLDGAPAPVDCVRPMREAVGDDIELIVDGGVRRGTHVLKALALGADAVSFGRPYLYALAAGGEAGVARFLSQMIAEIERGLALLGCARLDEIEAGHVQARFFQEGG